MSETDAPIISSPDEIHVKRSKVSASSLNANTGVRLAQVQPDAWLRRTDTGKVWGGTKLPDIECMAILHDCMVKLQAAYLSACHNLSREKQPGTRRGEKQNGNAVKPQQLPF